MKIKIKKVNQVELVPVFKKVEKEVKVEIFEVSKQEIEAAFLKWWKEAKGMKAQDIQVQIEQYSDIENARLNAEVLIEFLKQK